MELGQVSTREVAETLGVAPNAARVHLSALAEAGLLERVQVRPPNRRWVFGWRAVPDEVRAIVDDLDIFLGG